MVLSPAPQLKILQYITAALLLLGAVFSSRGERVAVSLDGKWDFRLDPQDVGSTGRWFASGVSFTNSIQVPGAWQAQGYGSESDKLWHSYIGKAWYKRQVRLPRTAAGQRLFLCFGGVHRSAKVWVNDQCLGKHLGYLSPFEFEIDSAGMTERVAALTVCVDCEQHWNVDCLTGCTDIIDEMFTPWGGISGHVWLEVRPAVWLEEVFVQPTISPPRAVVTARLCGDQTLADGARLEVRLGRGRKVVAIQRTFVPPGELQIETDLPGARLWSPGSPVLCTARLDLMKDGALVDRVDVPFGLREIQIRGCELFLNGTKLLLRGYGDDAIYPKTMAPPTNKEFYRKRLSVAKAYGFNFVRHHSHFLPPEYYEAADEVGMLVSPEFPIAYESYYQKAKGPALDLYRQEWAAIIKRLRNHPSIFDWCMANEMWGSFPLAPELYRAAKALDPTRPVLDSDGLPADVFVQRCGDRDTLDFFPVQFDEAALPLDKPGKHQFGGVPKKPVLSHETGNYVTVPRLSLIDEFRDNFKPFWLFPFRARLAKLGLTGEAEQWSLNSERLYYLAHKLNEENMRKNPQMSGYTWWLLQDYWTGANGLLDTYFRPKSIGPDAVRQFNAPVVLLQDGLALTYSAKHALKVRLLVSNYSPERIHNGKMEWTVRMGNRILASGQQDRLEIAQGELANPALLELALPAISQPEKLVLLVELRASGLRCRNDWYAWVYPVAAEPPHLQSPLFASEDLLPLLQPLGAQPMPSDGLLPARAVFVVNQPTLKLLTAVESGASLICLSPQKIFPSVANRFKSAWWLGSQTDCNAGTVVYPHSVTRAIAPDGWCDLGWYRLLEGAHACVLDDFPVPPDVLVRGLDVHTVCRNKALLFEAKAGRGSIIASGLRLEPNPGAPERAWLLTRLIEYAGTFPQPKAALPISFLREKIENPRNVRSQESGVSSQ